MTAAMPGPGFKDHFSAVAAAYAHARPGYPDALFDWIAAVAPSRRLAWEAGCGSGQATRSLAMRFERVHATDASAAQVAQASAPANARFAVEPAEQCSLDDGSADVACVSQALHWFDRPRYFDECARVLRPGGVLVALTYDPLIVPPDLAAAVGAFNDAIQPYWPPGRTLVGTAYAGFDWPFAPIDVPMFTLEADWPLVRLLAYFSSYSAAHRCRQATGVDPVDAHAQAIARAWGDPDATRRLRWPLCVYARRAP